MEKKEDNIPGPNDTHTNENIGGILPIRLE